MFRFLQIANPIKMGINFFKRNLRELLHSSIISHFYNNSRYYPSSFQDLCEFVLIPFHSLYGRQSEYLFEFIDLTIASIDLSSAGEKATTCNSLYSPCMCLDSIRSLALNKRYFQCISIEIKNFSLIF